MFDYDYKKWILAVALIFCGLMAQSQNKTYRMLFLGDSYTVGEGVNKPDSYPYQLISELRKSGIKIQDPKIVAKTGWTSGELMDALLEDEDYSKYDFVFLCIGVNNQFRGIYINVFEKEINTLINYASMFSNNKPENVFVLSIPDYGYTPFGKEKKNRISVEIDMYNEVARKQAVKAGVNFIDITELSRNENPEMLTGDNLHPSKMQYKLWVDKILSFVKN